MPEKPKSVSYFPSSTSDTFPPITAENDGSGVNFRHPLEGHPNPEVNELAQSIINLDEAMTSRGVNGTKRKRFPENVTLWNFADYQLIPTLVYELEYPRTKTWVQVPLSPTL